MCFVGYRLNIRFIWLNFIRAKDKNSFMELGDLLISGVLKFSKIWSIIKSAAKDKKKDPAINI